METTSAVANPSSRTLLLALLAIGGVVGGTACDGKPPPPIDGGRLDGGRLDAGGGGGSSWSLSVVDTGGVGMQLSAAVGPGDEGRLAYFATAAFDDGPCTEIPLDPPPTRRRWQIRYAHEDGAGAWAVEDVAAPLYLGVPVGLQLRTAPSGTPVIATMIGDPVPTILYCGANDVGVLERGADGTWSATTVVTTSGQAVTGQPASDYGDVVGYWIALAFDHQGRRGLAYKDVHAGSLQGDDFKRADLEIALENGGGWSYQAVDVGEGAGNYNALVFDADDQPVIAYHVPTESLIGNRHGIWAARSTDGGATWERVQIHRAGTAERLSMTTDPATGQPVLAYYDAGQSRPVLARVVDASRFTDLAAGWSLENLGDPRYDEGYHPSVAIDPSGNLAIAYYRCRRLTRASKDCDPNDDALVFAWLDAGFWEIEVVDEGGSGACGMYPSLAFDSTGRAILGYQCAVQVEGGFEFQTKVAIREPLL